MCCTKPEEDSIFTRYVYLLELLPGRLQNEAIIRAHVQHLKQLDRNGQLILCGPFSDHKGGMVIIKADSYVEAVRIAESDPFVKEGFETYELRTLELSCEENNHMGMG